MTYSQVIRQALKEVGVAIIFVPLMLIVLIWNMAVLYHYYKKEIKDVGMDKD